jgi:uncharacterized protein (UPF0248 family)
MLDGYNFPPRPPRAERPLGGGDAFSRPVSRPETDKIPYRPYMDVRLRMALEALQWGEGRKLAELEFVIVDRAVPGGQRMLPGRDLTGRDASFLTTKDGTQIPFHRVVEVRLEGRTVWRKRTRADRAAKGEGEDADVSGDEVAP